jgi:hypothetical protein
MEGSPVTSTPAASGSTGIMGFAQDNPVLMNLAMSAAKDMADAPAKKAALQQQIIQTQYSPWLGGGMGDISPYIGSDGAKNAAAAVATGLQTQQAQERDKKLLEILKAKSTFQSAQPSRNMAPNSNVLMRENLTNNPYSSDTPQENLVEQRSHTFGEAGSTNILNSIENDMLGRNPYREISHRQPVRQPELVRSIAGMR